jgi:hypothetical protein
MISAALSAPAATSRDLTLSNPISHHAKVQPQKLVEHLTQVCVLLSLHASGRREKPVLHY